MSIFETDIIFTSYSSGLYIVVANSVVPLAVIYSIPSSCATFTVFSSDAIYLELITLGVTPKYVCAFLIILEIASYCLSYDIPQNGS